MMKGSPRIRPLAVAALAVAAATALIVTLLLCATSASAVVPLPDYNEPNDSFSAATPLTNGTTAYGAITTQADQDYFYLDLAVASAVVVDFTTGGYPRACKLSYRASGGGTIVDLTWDKLYDDDASFHDQGTVGPGRLFAVVSAGTTEPNTLAYTITVTATGGGSTLFPDVPAGSEFSEAITDLAQEGVISGYMNGNFGPRDPVTRQQFAKMIVRAVGYPVSTSDICPFLDVMPSTPGHYLDANDPLYPDHYISVAAAHGITVGIAPTVFRPDHKITMAQVVTMVVRTAEDKGVWDSPPSAYEPPFDDFGAPHYANARMGAAHGLFNGYSGSYSWFSPPATRGQCAFFIWKLMLALKGDGDGPEPVY
jgi:hypothetical protein